jgi:hypothetical protein
MESCDLKTKIYQIMNKEEYIEFIERKIQTCIEIQGMEREKWAFIQCLKKARELEQSSITAVICRREQFCQCEELCNTNDSLIGEEICLKCDKPIDRQNCI